MIDDTLSVGTSRPHDPAFDRALAEARDGRAPGFDWLWHRFARQVAAFARAQGSEDPDGLSNDVFLGAFRALHTFRGGEDQFVALLFSITRKRLADEFRRRSRRPRTSDLAGTEDVLGGDAEVDSLAAMTGTTRAMLAVLSDDQREVLALRLVADLSLEQTARITGRSVNATKQLQHRAVNRLRKAFSREAVTK